MGKGRRAFSSVSEKVLYAALKGSLRRAEQDLLNMERRRLIVTEVRTALEIVRELELRGVQLQFEQLDREVTRLEGNR